MGSYISEPVLQAVSSSDFTPSGIIPELLQNNGIWLPSQALLIFDKKLGASDIASKPKQKVLGKYK